MALRYLSDEWLEEVRRRLEKSESFSKAAAGMSATVLTTVTGPPAGKDIHLFYEFYEGRIKEMLAGTGAELTKRASDFRASGAYETYVSINQGKLGSVAAVLQRKIKIEGNLVKAMKLVKALEAFNEVVRQIPTEY